MEHDNLTERLDAATSLLERTLTWLEERGTAATELAGEVGKISATAEQSRRETELSEKLAAAEQEITELKAAALSPLSPALHPQLPLRRTVPASTADMLAKHGIGDGPVDVRTLDAALNGLSLEQRIAVKSQLLRAGAIT
jgi:hypothetical protein